MSDRCSKTSRSDRSLLELVPITFMPIASAVLASLVPASGCALAELIKSETIKHDMQQKQQQLGAHATS